MKLRKYQEEIIDYIEASVAFGSTRLIVEAPTGSGKSLLIAELCRKYTTKRIVILVNVSKLIGQISEHLDVLGVEHSILKSGMEGSYDETKRVQIFMEQTYHARKDKILVNTDFVIRDEHHLGFNGDRFRGFVAENDPEVIIGFSATPYDQHGVALEGYETASFVDIESLTRQRYLMDAVTYVSKYGQLVDYSKIGKSGDYSESELDDLINRPEYNKDVVSQYLSDWEGDSAIVFVSGIEHAEDLASQFRKDGVEAYPMHSKVSAKHQAGMMSDFKSGQIDVLVTVSMLTTGFDMPDCNVMINCRPTKIRSLYVQMIGRVLRTDGDPLHTAAIIDCARATSTHGLYNTPFKIEKNRVNASEERKRRSEPIIDYIMNTSAGSKEHIHQARLDGELATVRTKVSVDAEVWRFENAGNAVELLNEACALYERFYKVHTTAKTKKWILDVLVDDIRRFGIGAFRTRLRNIIKDKKKIAGIRYFGDWLKKQQWS